QGADRGTPTEPPVPPGPISYARSLPRSKALKPEVLIAYEVNGRELRPDHGFPVRAIVPGHFGMASVKWLTRIEAVREPCQGYWQASDYGYWHNFNGLPVRRALGEMHLKSEIFPAARLRDAAGQPRLHGLWRGLGGRDRGDRDRAEHGHRPHVEKGGIPGPHPAARVAALDLRVGHSEGTRQIHFARPRQGCTRSRPAGSP